LKDAVGEAVYYRNTAIQLNPVFAVDNGKVGLALEYAEIH